MKRTRAIVVVPTLRVFLFGSPVTISSLAVKAMVRRTSIATFAYLLDAILVEPRLSPP